MPWSVPADCFPHYLIKNASRELGNSSQLGNLQRLNNYGINDCPEFLIPLLLPHHYGTTAASHTVELLREDTDPISGSLVRLHRIYHSSGGTTV